MSPDTIVPGAANPQAFNRYSYVLGNPLKYTDPTGHGQCQTQEDCEDMGTTPMGVGGNKPKPKPKPKGHGHYEEDIDPMDPNPNGLPPPAEPEIGIVEQILGHQHTPVAAAAVQVLSGTVFDIALPFAETPIGLGVTAGAFIVNRGSSMVGLASTFYQYQHQQNGTVFTDVVVSGGTFLLGWIPALTEPLAIASLIYSGYRLENDAPIDIPAPNH